MKLGAVAAAIFLSAATMATAQTPAAFDKERDEIWALEKAIYAGRAKGDFSFYIDNTSEGYVAWPPGVALPMRVGRLQAIPKTTAGLEKLEMEFLDFSLHGETAVIYYRTHMTQKVNGDPTDDRYHVTHTWVREDGKWKVFGGMARKLPPQ
ncbi:MAG: nuclear transport factor 2 family protein [Pseudomonadota bacterium]